MYRMKTFDVEAWWYHGPVAHRAVIDGTPMPAWLHDLFVSGFIHSHPEYPTKIQVGSSAPMQNDDWIVWREDTQEAWLVTGTDFPRYFELIS